ncbi:MAG: MurT ligase domain-containing protein [Candidatus Woykebacteria bacterium]
MDPRFLLARLASSSIKSTLRVFGGGATAAPGLAAEYIDPKALSKLTGHLSEIILVTGTNGKTTTSRIIGSILDKAGSSYIHNREGSNLTRGILTSLFSNTSFFPNSEKPMALLEVDEATLPSVISQTSPKVIVINNLFRDQLDRYGEVDSLRKIWHQSLRNLDSSTTLVLNADDPSVSHLGYGSKARVVYFGVEDTKVSLNKAPHASDFTSCIVCGGELVYGRVYLAHLGIYHCANCKHKRPKPNISAQNIRLLGTEGFKALIDTPEGKFEIKMSLPGLYNIYNCLSAVSCAFALSQPLAKTIQALKGFEAAFGRTESIEIGGKRLFTALAKNPAGFNEIIRTVFSTNKKRFVFIAINDYLADGTDVSWLWDVDFEQLKGKVEKIWISGVRAPDMSLRLKYAGISHDSLNTNLKETLEDAYTLLPQGETLFIFPTYTAMLEIKKILAEKGYGRRFWEE